MKVKTSYVPSDCDYLTVDKVYEVFYQDSEFGGWMIDDVGDKICIYYQHCPHLRGRAWEIVS